jgi:DNA mismatch repair protein MutS2
LEQAIGSAVSPAGEVLDDASPALRQLRQESRSAHQRLNEVMERNLRRLQRQELVQEPIVTQRNGRLVLLIKAEMRSRVPGIVHDVSDSGATVFVEPMPAIDLGNRWREARLAEEREEERVLRHLSSMVGQASQNLLLTLDLLARLDLAMAKGRYSAATRSTASCGAAIPCFPGPWCRSAWNWAGDRRSC